MILVLSGVCVCVHFYTIALTLCKKQRMNFLNTWDPCSRPHTKPIILGGDLGPLALQRGSDAYPGIRVSRRMTSSHMLRDLRSPAAATQRLTCEAQPEPSPRLSRKRRGNIKHIPVVGIWAHSCQAQSACGRGVPRRQSACQRHPRGADRPQVWLFRLHLASSRAAVWEVCPGVWSQSVECSFGTRDL